MRIEDFTFEVRDENLNRLGQILPGDLVGWESVLRFNNVGVWSIEMVATVEMAQLLSTPGYGIIVTHKDAGVILSGPTISAETIYEQGDPLGVTKIMGVDDSVILADRLAYPQPSNADVATQTSAYDSVSFMQASTAMYWYVERNLKPGVASATRAIPNLTIATDTGIGSNISKSARFDVLGTLLADIAAIDGLGFDIKQVDGNLEFNVFQPTDRSGTIRMDVANQTLSKTSFGYGAPQITHAIVAGQGQGLNRQLIDVTTTDSLSAESLFARRIESFIDQRNTGDVDELTQAGLEKLADGGQTQTSVDVIPSSDITMQYGTDWNLGDRVTVVVANQEVSATVTQVSIKVESNGVFIGATVGEPNGVDFEAIVTRKQTNSATRVDALERKETPAIVWNDAEGTYEFVMKGGNVTQQIGAEQLAYVKNNTGATIANGSVVYPNGSTGTNNLILKAQANAESTSTKTFGVVTEDIPNGGHGWVTTFGMVHDINTSGLTEGASVYLSPTVAGGMTSTKPSAPNHMVLVGFCVRSHAVNGSIFVKVQNGFELDELHDVSITSVASGHVFVRNAGNTLWENKTLSAAGIASSTDLTNGLALKAPIASPTFTGTATIPTLSVTNDGSLGGNLTVTGETFLNGTEIQGDGKTMLRFSDTWLRINEDNDFTSGIYTGTGILRTDGNLQVGASGATLNVSSSAFTYKGMPAAGLVPVKPTSVRVGTASVGATGRVSVTSGTGFTLDGIFTSAYRNYKIIIDHRNMGGAYEYFRFIYGDNNWTTAGAYYGGGFYRQGSSTGIWQNTGDGYSYGSIGYTADGGYTMLDVFAPQWNGSYGKVLGFNSYGAGSHTQVWSDFMWNGFDAFTGIYIYNGGANYNAEVEVYGYNH